MLYKSADTVIYYQFLLKSPVAQSGFVIIVTSDWLVQFALCGLDRHNMLLKQ